MKRVIMSIWLLLRSSRNGQVTNAASCVSHYLHKRAKRHSGLVMFPSASALSKMFARVKTSIVWPGTLFSAVGLDRRRRQNKGHM